jgi:hypothetical protein
MIQTRSDPFDNALRVRDTESGQEFAVKERPTVEIADDGKMAIGAAGAHVVAAMRLLARMPAHQRNPNFNFRSQRSRVATAVATFWEFEDRN